MRKSAKSLLPRLTSRFRTRQQLWLMTDFGFYSWPEPLGSDASAFHEVRAATLEAERNLEAEGVAKGMDGMEKREERHKGLGVDGFEVVKEEEFVEEGYDQVDGDMASVEGESRDGIIQNPQARS